MAREKNEKQHSQTNNEDYLISQYVYEDVLKYEQVSRFINDSLTDSLSRGILGKDVIPTGIKIEREENVLIISIQIIVYYGAIIPQLSYDIQRSVKNTVEEHIGITVSAVNIAVEGIDRR
ncbi:MAG: Asp23/Gls24 family envelope stress response protein [Clostridiales bacterium]|nr:Asp23/Gls24 family envelope stress response protein [Clostridiales bacterium]